MAFEGKTQVAEKPVETEIRNSGRRCFVILPYTGSDGPSPPVNFESVFEDLIRPVLDELNLECIRADRVSRSGLIHKEMIENIISADIVIADVTMGSPDVFFELGIRQTARRAGTVVLRHARSEIPFNITGVRAIDYDLDRRDAGREQVLEDCRALLRTHIRNSLETGSVDSLVHNLMPELRVDVPGRVLPERRYFLYRLPSPGVNGPRAPKYLEIVTGDIADVDDIDAWVNPENTRMELGRLHDDSVSAAIRYLGSRRNRHGFVRDDAVARMLRSKVGRHQRTGIEPATTVLTRPGALARSNRVRLLVHVAAFQGEPGRGYGLIGAYRKCVTNALAAIDKHNAGLGTKLNARNTIRSVLIPLFGSQSTGESPHERVQGLVATAHQYLANWPDSKIERIAFLAYTQSDLELCQSALFRLGLKYTSGPRGQARSAGPA